MDKTVYKIIRKKEDWDEDSDYWMKKTPEERIEAVEYLRRQYILSNNLPDKMDKTIWGRRKGINHNNNQ
jgi:hypothetical protein